MMNLAGAYWLFPSFHGIYGEDCSDLAEDERKLSLFLTLRSLFFFFLFEDSHFFLCLTFVKRDYIGTECQMSMGKGGLRRTG